MLEWFIWARAYSGLRSKRPQEIWQWEQPAQWGQPAGHGALMVSTSMVSTASRNKAPSPRVASSLGHNTCDQKVGVHHRAIMLDGARGRD